MDDSLKKILKNALENKNYEKYNDILIKEITAIFVKKIKKYNEIFLYSNQLELLENSEIYLDIFEANICKEFYNIQKKDFEPNVLSELLMEIYEKICIKN